MSEYKGNLRNRIDNNLKLSIPDVNMNTCSVNDILPSTAPALSMKKYQSDDLPSMKNLMKKWKKEGHDDGFVSTPSSIISDKREPVRFASSAKDSKNFFSLVAERSPSEHFTENSTQGLSPLRFLKLSPRSRKYGVSSDKYNNLTK